MGSNLKMLYGNSINGGIIGISRNGPISAKPGLLDRAKLGESSSVFSWRCSIVVGELWAFEVYCRPFLRFFGNPTIS